VGDPQGNELRQDIPDDWSVRSLRSLVCEGKTTLNPQQHPDETFDYYSIPAFQERRAPELELGSRIRSQKLVIESGTVLFGKLNPRVPKVWLVSELSERRKIASTEFIPLVATGEADPQFLYFLASSGFVLGPAQRLVSGSTPSRQRVEPSAFFDLPVPVPPLPEQRAIARVLRTVQEAKEQTEQVIAAAKELKRSLMRHLFTYGRVGVRETGAAALQTGEFGDFPSDWSRRRVGDVAKVRAGYGFPPRLQGKTSGEYPFYKVSDMNLPGNERVLSRANNYVDADDLVELRAKPMIRDTIVFPKVGAAVATNKKRLLGVTALVDNNVMGVEVTRNDLVRPEFLHRWFETIDLTALSNPGPLPSITAQAVKNAEFPLPQIETQDKIGEALFCVETKIEIEHKRRDALTILFDSLLQDLMTAQVRVDHLAEVA
jgi:type I restriction enzyme S subunit